MIIIVTISATASQQRQLSVAIKQSNAICERIISLAVLHATMFSVLQELSTKEALLVKV